MGADVAFAVASALHAGFQLTVTVLVYPALASRSTTEWARAHDRHSRAITPLVGLVYAALVGTGAWLVTTGPGVAAYVGLGGAAAALLVTAALAAPLHGRLGVRDDVLVARLLVVDRWRYAAALVGAAAAVITLL